MRKNWGGKYWNCVLRNAKSIQNVCSINAQYSQVRNFGYEFDHRHVFDQAFLYVDFTFFLCSEQGSTKNIFSCNIFINGTYAFNRFKMA